jgi:hypothetical protein
MPLSFEDRPRGVRVHKRGCRGHRRHQLHRRAVFVVEGRSEHAAPDAAGPCHPAAHAGGAGTDLGLPQSRGPGGRVQRAAADCQGRLGWRQWQIQLRGAVPASRGQDRGRHWDRNRPGSPRPRLSQRRGPERAADRQRRSRGPRDRNRLRAQLLSAASRASPTRAPRPRSSAEAGRAPRAPDPSSLVSRRPGPAEPPRSRRETIRRKTSTTSSASGSGQPPELPEGDGGRPQTAGGEGG